MKIRRLCQLARKEAEEGSYIVHNKSALSDSESDTSDEDSDIHETSLQDITETLLNEIELLLDLGPRLEEPISDCVLEVPAATSGASPATTLWDPVKYFTDRVLSNFPNCDPGLATALGKSNWESMTRLKEKRENALSTGQADNETSTPVMADKTTFFHDSGLGASLPINTSYASTIDSCPGDEITRAKIPPLPSDTKEGQLFQCMTCGDYVKKRDMAAWK